MRPEVCRLEEQRLNREGSASLRAKLMAEVEGRAFVRRDDRLAHSFQAEIMFEIAQHALTKSH